MKKISLFLVLTMALLFSSCSSNNANDTPTENSTSNNKSTKSIYYLNFKPEIADVYEKIAKQYETETGVKLNVVTAASGTYEQTLKSEMAKSDAPTLFQINGPKGYAAWKDYCADLTDSELYEHLSDKSLAIENNGKIYGIPYVVEGYGLIYNDALVQKYINLDGAKIKSIDEINNFNKLKEVVEDMSNKKDELGITGVFASTSLKPGEDWRWHTHLANIPIYYEFTKNKIDLSSNETNEIKFEYNKNFKNIFDLYLNNSTVDSKLLGSKQVADSMAEFALGQCVFVQNGNWAWSQISEVAGNVVKEEDIKFMPIYTGIKGEEHQGLCTGTENFFAINKKASEEQQKLAKDFIYWLYSSTEGKKFVVNDLNFIAPFDTFNEDEKPQDPLAKEVVKWMEKENIKSIPWNFTVFPNQTFKNDFGSVLLQYAQKTIDWNKVVDTVITNWKAESNY